MAEGFIRTDTCASSSRPGERFSTKRPDTFTRTYPSPRFKPLAVRRRTIHYQHQVFRHAVGLFFRLLLSSADLGWNLLQTQPSWRWKSGKRCVLSKRSIFSTAIKLPPAATADVDNLCHWTAQPRPCAPTYSRLPPPPCCAALAAPADVPIVRILRCRT